MANEVTATTEKSLVNQVRIYATNAGINKTLLDLLGQEEMEIFKNSVIMAASDEKLKDEVKDAKSVWEASLKAATLKLSLDPVLKQGFLIPRAKKATFQPSVRGLWTLAKRSGKLKKDITEAVYSDEFVSYDPFNKEIKLIPPKLSGERYKATAEPMGYFSKYILKDGYEDLVFKTKEEMEKWRDRYSAMYNKNRSNSRWTTHFDEMALKTVAGILLRRSDLLSPKDQRVLNEIEEEENTVADIVDEIPEDKKAKGRKINVPQDDVIDAVVSEKENLEELEAFGG